MSRTLNVRQAADYAGVHIRTIYNWIAAGKVPVWRTPTGQKRVRADDLLVVVQNEHGQRVNDQP